jgi:hypothetical protein
MNARFEVDDDFCTVTGSPPTAEPSFEVTARLEPGDQLGLHVLRLVNVNPSAIKFRDRDLEHMDDATKQFLIEDFNFALEIDIIKR